MGFVMLWYAWCFMWSMGTVCALGEIRIRFSSVSSSSCSIWKYIEVSQFSQGLSSRGLSSSLRSHIGQGFIVMYAVSSDCMSVSFQS